MKAMDYSEDLLSVGTPSSFNSTHQSTEDSAFHEVDSIKYQRTIPSAEPVDLQSQGQPGENRLPSARLLNPHMPMSSLAGYTPKLVGGG
jgi:hypothetical protein